MKVAWLFYFLANGQVVVVPGMVPLATGARVKRSKVKKFGIKKEGLRRKLLVVETLVFILPCLTLSYVFFANDFTFETSQLLIFCFILILILGGLAILRQIFNGFVSLEESMKRVVHSDALSADVKLNARELNDINQAFEQLIRRFEGTSKELQKKSLNLLLINDLNKNAFRLVEIDQLFSDLLEKAMIATNANIGSVFLVEHEKERFRIVAAAGRKSKPPRGLQLPIKQSLVRSVVYEKSPLLVKNIETDSRTLKTNDPKYNSPSFLSMPIFVRDKLVAVLNLSCKGTDPVFNEDDEQVLSIMIAGMGVALENAFLHFKMNTHLVQLKEKNLTLGYTNDYLKKEIMQRSRAEAALKASKEKYRLLFENANDGIFIIQDEKIFFPNPKAMEMSGKKAAEMSPTSFIDFMDTKDSFILTYRHRKCLTGEKLPKDYAFQIVNRAGEKRWVEHNILRISWDGSPATLNFLTDITQKKKLENQVFQAQKMKAIGTLVGGIAHGFNNLFMGIQGNVSLMLLDVRQGSAFHERLKRIEKCIDSGATLTKQLLGFARGGKYMAQRVDLNKTLQRTAKMFDRSDTVLTVHQQYQTDLFQVRADQEQIEQVFVNIFDNAIKAMPDGGNVNIRTRNEKLDEGTAERFGVKPGKYVKISIHDTGCGMSNATKKRIFEPFFTTQNMGKGAGMGLASAFGIIENHSGFIQVDSMINKGTTVTIFLPVSGNRGGKTVLETEELAKGSETILFIDSDEIVRDVVKPKLEKTGYRVFIADNGKEAIDVYKRRGDDIDLVILDMAMKGMDGGEVYSRLKRLNADIKAIFFSSLTQRSHSEGFAGNGNVIKKPLDMKKLSVKIRDVLDERPNISEIEGE